MNTSHTPGSFRVIATEANTSVVSQDGIHISDIDGYGATHETNKANGALLASAPDLLAALELVYANAAESPEWIRERIGPAIAKAKGDA
jgi:hypothetical protein